jgi:putative SOS response-associated peptidase YedK
MCGRFALFATAETVADHYALTETPTLTERYNISPTQPVAVVRRTANDKQPEFTYLHWGLVPSWSRDKSMSARLINARSETADEKPSFRAAFKRRRCLIPASGFYEWQQKNGRKQPMFIHPAPDEGQDGLFSLAGLWEVWHAPDGSVLESCTILTTSPNELMEPIHNRMPLILETADYGTWLDPETETDELRHLLRPYPAELMEAYAVSTAVNKPGNDSPACILPA